MIYCTVLYSTVQSVAVKEGKRRGGGTGTGDAAASYARPDHHPVYQVATSSVSLTRLHSAAVYTMMMMMMMIPFSLLAVVATAQAEASSCVTKRLSVL